MCAPPHTIHSPNKQVKWFNWILAAIFPCYVNYHQQDCDAYPSMFTSMYNCQVHRSLNTISFDLVPNQRVAEFTKKSTVSTGKTLTAAKQRAAFVATLQHSLCCARASFRHTKERCKRDFDKRLREGHDMVRTSDNLFIVISHNVTKTSKLIHAVIGP